MTQAAAGHPGLRVLGYLATFVVGAVFGAGLMFASKMVPMVSVFGFTALSQSDDQAYVAYRYGTYAVARARVLEHVKLEEGLARRNDAIRGKIPTDFMLWYGRLAVAAERAGAADDAKEFWRRAVEAVTRGGRAVTEEEIRHSIQKLDARWDARLAGSGS